jgi:DNA-binding MarR family transcriptional regulator
MVRWAPSATSVRPPATGHPGCSRPKLRPLAEYLQIVSRNQLRCLTVAAWSFFTNHARVLICIARDPGIRLRDLAAVLDITERSAHGIVTDLVEAGYVEKDKDGRRNRYRVLAQRPLPESISRELTIGDVLGVLLDADARRHPKTATKEAHVW